MPKGGPNAGRGLYEGAVELRNEIELRGLLDYLNTRPVKVIKQQPGLKDLDDKEILLMMGGMAMMLRWVLGEGPDLFPPRSWN